MRLLSPLLPAALLLAGSAVAAAPLAAQSAGQSQSDAEMKEVTEYRLTEATLVKLGKVQDNLYAALKANPGLARKYATERQTDDDGENEKSLDQMAKDFDRMPEVKQAIVKGGLTPREYLVISLATMQAAMAEMMSQTPGVPTDAGSMPAAMKANVAFLRAHKAQMDRMQTRTREIERLTRAANGEGSGESTPEPPDTSRARHRR